MSDRLPASEPYRSPRWRAPAAGADVAVGDYPQHIAAVLRREAAHADRSQREMVAHAQEGTPISLPFAIFAACYLGACIGLVALLAFQLARVYG